MSEPTPSAPAFSVVKGSPTDEELAAVVVVLSQRAAGTSGTAAAPVTGWSAYWRSIRTPLPPGPGVWRMSGRS